MDTYGYLYTLPFIPSSPQSNLVVAKDDGGSQGNFQITVAFTVTQSMILVVTTYHPEDIGEFNISIHGPAQLSLTPYISASNTVTNTNETTSVETTAKTTATPIITTATTVTTKVATKKSTKRTTRRTKKKPIRPTITAPTAVTDTVLIMFQCDNGDRTDRRETKRCGQSVADKTSHGQIVAGQIVAGQNVVDKTLRTKCRGQIVAKKLSRGQIVAWTNRRMDKLLHGQNVAWTKCCNIAYCYKCLFRG
ncbi:unnamed protein product [Rotaria magnacalcarata]|uniref:Uncharacterized protein n=2 Tax=Rotaria magnacalcarata TaxID=392030 RepID=A0A816WK42_9BILA|nr:unnamed protein product [Rotaria magnacalcarata]CAF4673152.1 unnamed protein product [Rotaria magnacalcarata]